MTKPNLKYLLLFGLVWWEEVGHIKSEGNE
jgi:hypothetical protein